MVKKKTRLISLLNILLILFFYDSWGFSDSLEDLRSLPYVSWTGENIDTNNRGVVKYDASLAYDGLNLYTNDVDKIFLMDMEGKILHEWYLPGSRHLEYAEILDNGNIVVVCVGQWLAKMDWDSHVIWKVKGPISHDVALLPDGTFLTVFKGPHYEYNPDSNIYDKLFQVFLDGKEINRKEWGAYHWFDNTPLTFDGILHVSQDGDVLKAHHFFDYINNITRYHLPIRIDIGDGKIRINGDYYHVNTIESLPCTELGTKDHRFQEGNLLVSFRNVNLIAVLDNATMDVLWSFGPGILDFPHMPTMLDSGNILIFDNGKHRGYSRVIEVDPVTKEIVWEYQQNPPDHFFSEWRGSSQRLPNENTLICESEQGHVFEVTQKGDIVWEFFSPEIKDGKRKRIYRFMRYPKENIGKLLKQHEKSASSLAI